MTVMSQNAVIAVMGMTGVGKSSFIQSVTGRSDIKIGHTLESATEEVTPYEFRLGHRNITLVDTPGFNDSRTNHSDEMVVGKILRWLERSYSNGTRLSGLIYVHRIQDPRMQGTALANMKMFHKLCGPDCYKNIVLATSFWDGFDEHEGGKRENELRENDLYWGTFIRKGSTTARVGLDQDADKGLVLSMAQNATCVLEAQREMQDGVPLSRTAAAQQTSRILWDTQENYERQLKAEQDKLRDELRQREAKARHRISEELLPFEDELEQLRQQSERQKTERSQREVRDNEGLERQKIEQEQRRASLRHFAAEAKRLRAERKRREGQAHFYSEYRCKRSPKTCKRSCDKCGRIFDVRKEKFYHCCFCNNENYDLCSRCGPGCSDPEHPLLELI